MAKPIGVTPILEGRDAAEVINRMYEPPTEKEKEYKKRIDNARGVPF